jgi:2',3'-cyclic-nucleotide 2'-phosphodiesterase (5'-nucleotidase family)
LKDLHDGAGLSDASSPNGNISNAIFENVDYDLLTIGNHELYVTEIAYEQLLKGVRRQIHYEQCPNHESSH